MQSRKLVLGGQLQLIRESCNATESKFYFAAILQKKETQNFL